MPAFTPRLRALPLLMAAGMALATGAARAAELDAAKVDPAKIDAVFAAFTQDTPGCALGVYREGQVLLARNAAWPMRFFGLITGFMEAGESPTEGIAREVAEETGLQAQAAHLIGVYDFQKKNQLIVAYHVPARGEILLSPELSEYILKPPAELRCWPAGTGQALADWLRGRGITPQWLQQS